MGRPKKKAKDYSHNEGARAAGQIVFFAQKYRLIPQKNLCNIAKSQNFHKLFLAVCREEPTLLGDLLGKARKVCDEANDEDTEARQKRKRDKDEKNASYKKRDSKRCKSEGTDHVNDLSDNGDSDVEILDENGEKSGTDLEADIEEVDEEMDNEDEQESPKANDNEPSTVADRVDREVALTRGEPIQIDQYHCYTQLAKDFGRDSVVDVRAAMENILQTCVSKLNAEFIQSAIVEFLEDLLKLAGTLERPTVSADSCLEAIIKALQVLSRDSGDISIRCITVQMIFFRAVQRQCVGSKDHVTILRDIAEKVAGTVTPKRAKKIYESYIKDYNSGKKWQDVVNMFGGEGIVIVFVVAEIGPCLVTRNWTAIEREILRYFAQHLHGTRKIVACLGDNVLETYSRIGHLEKDAIEKLNDLHVYDD